MRREKSFFPWIGLVLGPLLFGVILSLEPPQGCEPVAWRTAAVGALMAAWWMTEAIPLAMTALLPLVLFPLLGIKDIASAASPYANPVIFLFLGGFLIALAMQRWDLHRRIALYLLSGVGSRPSALVAGFMVVTAVMSMWVSNTASALMMLPIGLSVIALFEGDRSESDSPSSSFALATLLGIAYAASIGGVGTLIGTPPNAFLAGFVLETYGREIGFAQWMAFALPLVAISLPIVFVLLTRVLFSVSRQREEGVAELLRREKERLGRMQKAEIAVAVVFLLTAGLWIARPWIDAWLGRAFPEEMWGFRPRLSDPGIALSGALILFLIPVNFKKRVFVMSWQNAQGLPWGVLLLFGGGLSLASAVEKTGLAIYLGRLTENWQSWHTLTLLFAICGLILFLTELTSNTATAAAFLPVLGSVAVAMGEEPLLFLVPATVVASFAFMLPVATPPNAVVFSSERIALSQMVRAGFWLNSFFLMFVPLYVWFVGLRIFSL